MKEIWKPIEGYEGLYEVSNLGRVRSLPRATTKGKVLKPRLTKFGYARVNLWRNGKSRLFLVHRLVAAAFISNPENKPQVNHIDENKANNCADNLEWCTNLENHNHGTINQRISATQTNDPNKSKPVAMFSKCGDLLGIFPSMSEAERKTGICPQCISCCCNGKYKSAGGYIWKFYGG